MQCNAICFEMLKQMLMLYSFEQEASQFDMRLLSLLHLPKESKGGIIIFISQVHQVCKLKLGNMNMNIIVYDL